MAKNIITLILFISLSFCSLAQQDTTGLLHKSHLRISLLTCTPGEEVWETFGHTCIRIIDSAQNNSERDKIYNYGFFDISEDNSIGSQFFNGRVKVMLDTITYDELMAEYTYKRRGIVEQVFLLNDEQKEQVASFLKNNLKRENRYYDYDTFHDNCTTRVLDLFRKIFGNGFVPGQVLSSASRLTYRDVTADLYCTIEHKYWFRLALNTFYASRSDAVMSNTDVMFLASYFSDGMAGAIINGNKVCDDKKTILEDKVSWPQTPDWPFILFLLIAVITIASLLYKKHPVWGNIVSAIVLFSTGLLGCLMLYLWKMDGEPAWKDNFNILWALPTNIIIPFLPSWIKTKYALAAIFLIGVSLLLDILKIQVIPLHDISSLLLALIWIYAMMYRKNMQKATSASVAAI